MFVGFTVGDCDANSFNMGAYLCLGIKGEPPKFEPEEIVESGGIVTNSSESIYIYLNITTEKGARLSRKDIQFIWRAPNDKWFSIEDVNFTSREIQNHKQCIVAFQKFLIKSTEANFSWNKPWVVEVKIQNILERVLEFFYLPAKPVLELHVEPDVLRVNEIAQCDVTIKNKGGVSAQRLRIETEGAVILNDFTDEITLPPLKSGKWVLNLEIKDVENVVLRLSYIYGDQTYYETEIISVKRPEYNVDITVQDLELAVRGDLGNRYSLTYVIENKGEFPVRDIKLELKNLPSILSVTYSQVIPLLPPGAKTSIPVVIQVEGEISKSLIRQPILVELKSEEHVIKSFQGPTLTVIKPSPIDKIFKYFEEHITFTLVGLWSIVIVILGIAFYFRLGPRQRTPKVTVSVKLPEARPPADLIRELDDLYSKGLLTAKEYVRKRIILEEEVERKSKKPEVKRVDIAINAKRLLEEGRIDEDQYRKIISTLEKKRGRSLRRPM
jgi:hypothetical protein